MVDSKALRFSDFLEVHEHSVILSDAFQFRLIFKIASSGIQFLKKS